MATRGACSLVLVPGASALLADDERALFPLSRASLSYSPSTSFHRRIVYQCAAFLGLQTATGEAKAIVVRLPTELYALTRCVLLRLPPA